MAKRKKKNATTAPMCDYDRTERKSVSVRKISNGFIVSKDSSGKDGYKNEEIYTAKKPSIELQVKESKAREKRLSKVSL